MNSFRVVLLVSLFSISACKSKKNATEKTQINPDQLYGHWLIQDAMRNNRPTQTINGAVFLIDSVVVRHNIFGGDAEYVYQITDSAITTSDQIKYNVEFLNDTLMYMNALIQNYKFRFSLKKQLTIENQIKDSLSEVQ
jgi:hypothetical protein